MGFRSIFICIKLLLNLVSWSGVSHDDELNGKFPHLIFTLPHAILSPVTKPTKPRSNRADRRFPALNEDPLRRVCS